MGLWSECHHTMREIVGWIHIITSPSGQAITCICIHTPISELCRARCFSKFSLALSGKLMVHLLARTLVLLTQMNFKWQWIKLALRSNGIKPRDMHSILRCYPIILPFPKRNENGCSNTSIWFYVVKHLWQFILNVVLIGPFEMQCSPFGINNEAKSPWWKMLTTIENRIL